MQTISFHDFVIPAPSSLSELSKRQCRLLAGALFFNLEVPRLKLLMFMAFLRDGMLFSERMWYLWHIVMWPYFVEKTMLGYLLFQKMGINTTVKVMTDEMIVELSEWHTEWMFEDNGIIAEQKFRWLAGYYGASVSLNNICFRQFRMAEEFAYLYGSTKDVRHLNTLLAWLYMPKHIMEMDADSKAFREALSPLEVKLRAEKIGKVDIETRYYLYLWYLNAKAGIVKKFDVVFEAPTTSVGVQTKKPLDNLRQSFASMLVMRSEHVTKMEDTDFAALFDVLAFFRTEILQAKAVKN